MHVYKRVFARRLQVLGLVQKPSLCSATAATQAPTAAHQPPPPQYREVPRGVRDTLLQHRLTNESGPHDGRRVSQLLRDLWAFLRLARPDGNASWRPTVGGLYLGKSWSTSRVPPSYQPVRSVAGERTRFVGCTTGGRPPCIAGGDPSPCVGKATTLVLDLVE